ncbi:U6 snRNA-associated Sm-like protein LSm7 [Golovinomyces cichoracearum]|uniref:U6 snRNA-associated Sm-like protein LSm7 n=1 Tax=Golovinomyces cichoracearum TaxID=62708 RepID=A0A420IGH7_9PEZI|nr:U6 snRNA-associated Sm-like protein LSm7 [Golovinomyces cichoracearum]
MSHRGQNRGNRGANRGNRGGRGGYDSSRVGSSADRPKKENILDLGKIVTGFLKGYDALMNLVLDDVEESMHDDENKITTRSLGLVVVRGTLLVLISPVDGSEEIANPFVQGS